MALGSDPGRGRSRRPLLPRRLPADARARAVGPRRRRAARRPPDRPIATDRARGLPARRRRAMRALCPPDPTENSCVEEANGMNQPTAEEALKKLEPLI